MTVHGVLPGLTATFGAVPYHNFSSLLEDRNHLCTDRFQVNNLCGILRRFPTNPAAGVCTNSHRNAGIAIDAGPDLRIGDDRATPTKLLEAYLKQGPEFVRSLDGQFLLIAWDESRQQTLLASDRYGLRPHYIQRLNDKILIGTSVQEMSRIEGRLLKLDERAIFTMLSYSRVSPGSITWFEGFEALQPATRMIWSDGRLIEEALYWDYFGTQTRTSACAIDEIADAFRVGVRNSMDTGLKTGICLSGGLDSRIVVAAMPFEMRREAIAYTWGAKRHSDEVTIAEKIAKKAGIDWQFVQMAPEDFVTDLEGAVDVLEGRDHAIQGYGRKAFAEVRRNCEAATTGLALDILVSGSYASFLGDSELEKMPFEQAKDAILDRYRYFKFPLEEMFLNPVHAEDQIAEVRYLLKQDFTEISDERANCLDRFALRQRVWRQIFPRQQWQRLFVEDVSPTFSNKVIDLLCAINAKDRANFALAKKILGYLEPSLLAIPYQGTLLPASVPVDYWRQAIAIEAQKEALYRNIYHATKGQVFLPYERYYTNFDEWQRMDPSWSEALDHYLLNDNSRLVSGYVRRDWVRKLIEDQRSGAAANFARINVLISLELLLRKFS